MNQNQLTSYLLSRNVTITPLEAVTCLLCALVLAMFMYYIYRKTYTGVAYSRNFNVSLVLLAIITTIAMLAIGNNLTLSLGMVGSLSIIRFRTAIKEPKDIAFVFWAISIGLCCGASMYIISALGSVMLAVVLVVILLLACGFLFAQRYMVYDADGSVRFEFPWIKKTPQDDTANGGDSGDDKKQDDLEITVQKPVIKDTCAVELGADALGSDWQAALDGLDKDVNAVAVELKDASGKIHYGSKVQGAIDCGAVAGGSASDAAIQGLVDSDYYTIGRISTLHDSLYAYEHMTDAAVCQLTGFVWYDTNSTHWLAPEKQAARAYVTDIVTECGKMGFDELLLDDFHYPREGRMSRIKTDERTMTQQEALALLADDIHTALEQAGYKGKLSVSVDADIALAGSEEKSGIVMSELTEKFDRVYVKVTADQLESVTEAMKAYDVEFVPIVTEATDSGSYLIEK